MPSVRIDSSNENSIHFITITAIAWLDIFTSEKYYKVLISSLKYCQEHKGLLLYEYVFMTNHIHLICAAKEGYKLSQFISDFKKHTTREVFKLLKEDNRKYLSWVLEHSFQKKNHAAEQLWQANNYPEPIDSEKLFLQKAKYIHLNPVRKGYVEQSEQWKYSSARNRMLDDQEIIVLENV